MSLELDIAFNEKDIDEINNQNDVCHSMKYEEIKNAIFKIPKIDLSQLAINKDKKTKSGKIEMPILPTNEDLWYITFYHKDSEEE